MFPIKPLRLASTSAQYCPRLVLHNVNPTRFNSAIALQTRASSFLNDSAAPSRSRRAQSKPRESWFSRKRKAKNSRSKISTLALDPTTAHSEAEQTRSKGAREEESEQQDEDSTDNKSQILNPRMRRLLLWGSILTMPIWGRDILETVIPGMLGVFLFVASRIKAGVRRIRRGFSTS